MLCPDVWLLDSPPFVLGLELLFAIAAANLEQAV
jgi:hypothetical protein